MAVISNCCSALAALRACPKGLAIGVLEQKPVLCLQWHEATLTSVQVLDVKLIRCYSLGCQLGGRK